MIVMIIKLLLSFHSQFPLACLAASDLGMKFLISFEVKGCKINIAELAILPSILQEHGALCHCCICATEGICVAMKALPMQPIVPNISLDFSIPQMNFKAGKEAFSSLPTALVSISI